MLPLPMMEGGPCGTCSPYLRGVREAPSLDHITTQGTEV